MSRERIGIEFGLGNVRVAAIQPGRASVVTALQNFTAPTDQAAVEAIKGFVSRTKLKGAPATFSVPSDLATLHWTKLPNVPLAEMHEIALFKLREHFAKNMDDLALGVVPFESVGDDMVEALVIAVPKEIVAQRAQLVEEADLEPFACEIEAQALIRIAQSEMASVGALFKQMSMTIVDLGSERTRFVVVQNRRVQFIRTVKFGSNRLVKVVAESLGITFDHAQVLVDQRSTVMGADLQLELVAGDETVRVDVSAAMDSLFKELRRLTTYFRTLRADRSYRGLMERLVLSGELVSIRGFTDTVGKCIGIGTQELSPMVGARFDLEAPDLALLASAPHRFSVAVGLALSPYHINNQEANHFATSRAA
jgi:type IV pilus assembly protein PilM